MLKSIARRFAAAVAARVPVGAAYDDEPLQLAVGGLQARLVRALPDRLPLASAEFKVFSQWGEDGILQYLLSKVDVPHRQFVEFGVENYREANTRFLLRHDNWRGLVIDGSPIYVESIKAERWYWRHDLTAIAAFVTAENINALIRAHVAEPDIGLLSIDIDGNDYWVWKAIDVVSPRIVICEYNSLFGDRQCVTVPYKADFDRSRAHHSNLYWGASLGAFCRLAVEKGYVFVGSNSAGNNAFFVRQDVAGRLVALQPEAGYVESRFRESRNESAELTYLSGDARLMPIQDLELFDLEEGKLRQVRDLYARRLERTRQRQS